MQHAIADDAVVVGLVQHAPVVPHHDVTRRPGVPVDVARRASSARTGTPPWPRRPPATSRSPRRTARASTGTARSGPDTGCTRKIGCVAADSCRPSGVTPGDDVGDGAALEEFADVPGQRLVGRVLVGEQGLPTPLGNRRPPAVPCRPAGSRCSWCRCGRSTAAAGPTDVGDDVEFGPVRAPASPPTVNTVSPEAADEAQEGVVVDVLAGHDHHAVGGQQRFGDRRSAPSSSSSTAGVGDR